MDKALFRDIILPAFLGFPTLIQVRIKRFLVNLLMSKYVNIYCPNLSEIFLSHEWYVCILDFTTLVFAESGLSIYIFFILFGFSTGLVRLYIAGLPTSLCIQCGRFTATLF